MALKDNPALPGASAILLDRDSYVDDAKSYRTEYYRIKIFKDEGRRFADIEIPYVLKVDEVVDIRARTVRADGTAAEFHGEIFDKLIVKSKRLKYQAKIFTLSEAQTGGIIEYSYKMIWHQHAPDVLKNPASYRIDGVGTEAGSERYYWTDLGRRVQESVEAFIGHSKLVQQVTDQTVSPSDSPDVKLRKIYARVQQVRNLSFEPDRTRKELKQENLKENSSAEDVLKRGFGYGDDINCLFAAMVRAAGMEAYAMKVVARDKHIFDPAVLDSSQFNAMVINVHVGNEDRFFDPANRFCPFEMIPWSESGVKGLRLSPVSSLINIPGHHAETAVTRRTANLKLDPDGNLAGKFNISFSGQDALDHRMASYDEDDAGRRKTLETEIKSWLPANAVVEITSSGMGEFAGRSTRGGNDIVG